ncbi:MAG TPA: ABC transporter substrate-binding protein [Acidimicrobiia bacterium]|nr:ABC transporter substrate-binding protein [Acidimicrobiia bacterium]
MGNGRRGRLGWPALAMGLVLAACTNGAVESTTTAGPSTTTQAPTTTAVATTTSTSTSTTAPGTPRGGEAIIGDDQEPTTLNPYALGGDSYSVARISRAWTCGTQEVDGETLELVPDLVVQLPTVANGGLTVNADGTETVRYRLREEAVWEDGTPVSGFDYEFTYRAIMDPANGINQKYYEDIVPDSVVAGAKTFEFTLSTPTLQVENLFSLILPRHQVEGTDFAAGYDQTGWLSCGPFRIDSWEQGRSLTLVRNDNYRKTDPETGERLPYLDSLVVRFYPDQTALLEAFREREVQAITLPEDLAIMEEIRQLEAEGALVDAVPGPTWEHLAFQFGENRLTRNAGSYALHLNFRKAVAHAIDRQLIVDEVLGGLVGPMSSYVDAFSPELSGAAWDQYDYDPVQAREYLAALCAEEGVDCEAVPPRVVFTATFNSPARVLLSQLFIDMFEDVGIAYEAELEDSVLFFGDTIDLGNWDLGEWSFVGRPGLAELVWWHIMLDPEGPLPTGLNFYRWGTPEVVGTEDGWFDQPAGFSDEHTARFAELWDLMNATINEGELTAYVSEAEAILADQVVIIPLYQRPDAGAVWADTLGGYQHVPYYLGELVQGGDTWNVETWYRKDL